MEGALARRIGPYYGGWPRGGKSGYHMNTIEKVSSFNDHLSPSRACARALPYPHTFPSCRCCRCCCRCCCCCCCAARVAARGRRPSAAAHCGARKPNPPAVGARLRWAAGRAPGLRATEEPSAGGERAPAPARLGLIGWVGSGWIGCLIWTRWDWDWDWGRGPNRTGPGWVGLGWVGLGPTLDVEWRVGRPTVRRLHACMYVCMYVCMSVCIHVSMAVVVVVVVGPTCPLALAFGLAGAEARAARARAREQASKPPAKVQCRSLCGSVGRRSVGRGGEPAS
eukprot:scaffold2380_cov380-Prasinococcus_capsulatus_cf.AAC.2